MNEKFTQLKKWLGVLEPLELFDRPERGIYSRIPIKKNKIIIRIKSKYLIEYQHICSIYPIENIISANSLVAFYLTKLHFENDDFWSKYLDILPNDTSNFVLFWNNKDLEGLKQTSLDIGFENWMWFDDEENEPLYDDLFLYKKSIEYDYEIIYNYNCENKIIDTIDMNIFDEDFYLCWLKYRMLVGSRIFGYEKHGNQTSGMVPLVDMINHSNESNSLWYFDDKLDSFILIATSDIKKNEEIFDSYGTKSNVDFLLYYGFTLETNPNPVVRIGIEDLEGKKIYYQFDLKSDLDSISYKMTKNIIINKLTKMFYHHKTKLSSISNSHVIQIYLDEIKVISQLIKKI